MFTFLMLLILLVGVTLTGTILMQNPKGGGLSSAFGGASGGFGSMLGVRHASDILAKTTWGLAIAFTILIFTVNMFFLPSEGTQESIIQRNAADAPISPAEKQQQMEQQAQPQTTDGGQQAAPAADQQNTPPPPPPAE